MGNRHRGSFLRRHCAASVAAIAFVAGAFWSPGTWAADRNRVNEQVFAIGYGRIAEAYLSPVDFGRLGVDGLKGLAGIDSDIEAELTGKVVRVYAAGTLTGEYTAPADAGGWAALTTKAVDRARSFSVQLRDAPAERIYQAIFDSVTADLDGYSRYTGVQRATNERAQRDGYGGVGITLDFVNGRPVVRDLIGRGPAERAGLKAGDRLVAVDGEPVAAMMEADVRERLRGPAGTLVSLTVDRDGGTQRRLSVRRERVVPNTVTVSISDGVAVLKLDRFNAATATNLRDALGVVTRAPAGSVTGVVLDLRGNPGGLLDQAVAVADLFITSGRIITTEGRHPDSRQRWDAADDDAADGLPLAVLVDGRSASSAEVVAAALQDSGRAVIIGAGSFGKGSVQTVTRLPNDGELFLTWSRIYTPAGYTLHRQGVQPTICTSRGGSNAAELLGDLRDGRLPSAVQLADWRSKAPDDDFALHQLRDACPWREHEPELDLTVAKLLLADSALYARAVTLSAGRTVAARQTTATP